MTLRLSAEQIERYSRQIMVPDIGGSGQIRLREARVLVIGAGGLGSPAAFYLAAAGIGKLGLIDPDRVELSNLQRQILHSTAEIGSPKVESAAAKLNRLNPEVEMQVHPLRLEEDNAAEILHGYDFIVDGSDNFPTKFLVNDTAIRLGIPFSHAGIVRLQGQLMTVIPGRSACYRCFFKEPPPLEEMLSCQQAGILGAVAGTIGTLQATETIKYICGFEDGLLTDRLLTYDARLMKFHEVRVRRDESCPTCGSSRTEKTPKL
ncbi:MAG TPA: HesA/MoeB/ThiF family protein [Candidatus Binatia bacterium]|jgi:adenylyltransferase/sulfurtransferase